MSVLAIVPARGGSKGIPRKNLATLGGRPLLAHTLEQARYAHSVDRVVVSTDDEEISEVALASGAEVVRRPAELAQDLTPTLPVLTHVLQALGGAAECDRIVVLQPTSPLRQAWHIDEAVSLLTGEFDSVVGVCEAEHSPYKMFTVRHESLAPLMEGAGRGVPRQVLPTVYRENGAVYVAWTRVLQEAGSLWGARARPYIMDARSSIDIDTQLDLQQAELLLHEDRYAGVSS